MLLRLHVCMSACLHFYVSTCLRVYMSTEDAIPAIYAHCPLLTARPILIAERGSTATTPEDQISQPELARGSTWPRRRPGFDLGSGTAGRGGARVPERAAETLSARASERVSARESASVPASLPLPVPAPVPASAPERAPAWTADVPGPSTSGVKWESAIVGARLAGGQLAGVCTVEVGLAGMCTAGVCTVGVGLVPVLMSVLMSVRAPVPALASASVGLDC